MGYFDTRLNIGSLQLPRFIGGPLDGVIDEPFRKTMRMFCTHSLLYTQIRHVASIVNAPRHKIAVAQETRPINFQVTASSTEYVQQACQIIQEFGVDAVDLNIGCPARNIIKNGAGSALMADKPRLEKILKLFRAHLACPFTIKMRAGFKEYNAQEIAHLAVACGVDALAIHPRLQSQRFSGSPDYTIVTEIKKNCPVPVLISGGVRDFSTAREIYEKTGVDGFLIGRAQLGSPWILKMMYEQSLNRQYHPEQALIAQAVKAHMLFIEEYYGLSGIPLARRHIGWYISGSNNASIIRSHVHSCSSWQQIHDLVAQQWRLP